MALYSIRLAVVFSNLDSGNKDFLVGLVMSSSIPLVFLTQMIFLFRRSTFLTFFCDLRQKLLNIDDGKGLERKIIVIYCIYFGNSVATIGVLFFSVLENLQTMDDWATVIAYGPYVTFVTYILCGTVLWYF